MITKNDYSILKGGKALELWRQGRDVWNKWVEENPQYNVDFSGVDFSKERNDENSIIDFSGFVFPEGSVTFYEAQFGGGGVSYYKAQFGTGDVSFSGAQFGEGYVIFSESQFGKGDVEFSGAQFGEGGVYFSEAQFGEGHLRFSEAQFGKGNVNFYKAQFGEGDVSFSDAQFGEGDVCFSEAQFGGGDVSYCKAQFGTGDVSFSGAQFGEGHADFRRAQFGKGYVLFSESQFGKGDVEFSGAQFGEGGVFFHDARFGEGGVYFIKVVVKGHFELRTLVEPEKITSLSLSGSEFCKTFSLSGNEFDCVVDLTETKVSHHVSLDNVTCKLNCDAAFKWGWLKYQKASFPKDAERFRRLKELADDNKDHESAMEFHAQEVRAKRWQDGTDNKANILDLMFDKVSNYGRDAFTPFKWLIRTWILFAIFYYSIAWSAGKNVWSYLGESVAFSAGQLLPIIPGARFAQAEGVKFLFNDNLPVGVIALTFIETLISLVLIFLIGLALRNRFRI